MTAEQATRPVVDLAWVAAQYRYEALTWPEVSVAVAQDKVIDMPAGSIEQHATPPTFPLPLGIT